jgi:hypothetical protein
MGAIVDIIHLDQLGISLLKDRYPDCVLINLTKTNLRIQQYRLIIPGIEPYDDSYYNFLFDNMIATDSRNFQSRFECDELFKQRIRARADTNLKKLQGSYKPDQEI